MLRFVIVVVIIILAIASCQVDSYSRFNMGNIYPNTTSIIIPVDPEANINWDSILTELSKCSKPILILEEQYIKNQNISELTQKIRNARRLKFHIVIRILTKYGERPIEEIASQLIYIQDFLSEINGLLIDEVLDNIDMFDYYYQLSVISRELGYDFIVMNTSNSVNPERFLEIADALIIYENMGIVEDIILDKDIRNKGISIIYTNSWNEIIPFIKYLRKGLIGKWVFITDNYYRDTSTYKITLPSFWKELVRHICIKG